MLFCLVQTAAANLVWKSSQAFACASKVVVSVVVQVVLVSPINNEVLCQRICLHNKILPLCDVLRCACLHADAREACTYIAWAAIMHACACTHAKIALV